MLSTMSSVPASPACVPALAQLPIMPSRPLQRPKLQINTLQPRVFGKAASLRLDTLSAVSPTARNTFSNAYEPQAPALTSAASDSSDATDSSAESASSASSALSASSASSASTTTSSTALPYKQPHNLSSILTNSPIAPRKLATPRLRFPAEKRVSFRTPLQEDITTVKYTLAHSDIPEPIPSPSLDKTSEQLPRKTLSPLSKPALTTSTSTSTSTATATATADKVRSPRAGEKRDSSSSEDESDTCPQTPVAGRRKRSRDWRWTLGNLPGSTACDSGSDDSS